MKLTRWFFALMLGFGSSPAVAQTSQPSPTFAAQVIDLHSNEGQVGCMLYDSAKGFPTDPLAAKQRVFCAIENNAALCVFVPPGPGTYAMTCFHDENKNGKLDTKIFGIPKEGVAASRDAKGRFGPPSYGDAKFDFAAGPSTLIMHMRYL